MQRDKLIRRVHEEMMNEGIQKTTIEIITKQNAVLKDLKELKKLTKSNNHLYEIIPEHLPRYFFMDIDIKKEELTKEEKSYLEKNDILEKLKEAISAVFEVDISDVVVLQSPPSTEKLSCHLIFKDIILRNREESKVVYKYLERVSPCYPSPGPFTPRTELCGSSVPS